MAFVVGEAKEVCSYRKRQGPMVEKCCYNEFFWGREDEDKRRHEDGQT